MVTKNDRKLPMSDIAQMSSLPRSTMALWVKREHRRTGSRMVAYKNIARVVGTSESWVRKFHAGSSEAKEPSWSNGLRIIEGYKKAISLFDRAAETEEAEAQNLKRMINAATAINLEMVEGETRKGASSTGTEQD